MGKESNPRITVTLPTSFGIAQMRLDLPGLDAGDALSGSPGQWGVASFRGYGTGAQEAGLQEFQEAKHVLIRIS